MLELTPGNIAVTQSGARILIWPNESDDPECFTGELIRPQGERTHVGDVSTLWDRSKVSHIETPNDH